MPTKPRPADDRYSRQTRFGPIGETGQALIGKASVLVCGCGALGSVIAERLVRAGVGTLRIVDRDWVELSNLQRQSLFNEKDAAECRPKAVAAARHLGEINSNCHIEALVEDVTCDNLESLAANYDLIVDGTDNFETRFLLNDYSLSHSIPWVHGGCLGASGQVMSFIPGQTACFRCLLPDLPPSDTLETCDSAGVLGSAIGIVASWQVAEALKILSGNLNAICPGLIVIDSWNTECRIIALPPQTDCPACQRREFPFLSGQQRTSATVLCGKNAVQIQSAVVSDAPDALQRLAKKLESIGEVLANPYFIRLNSDKYQITIFRGGRTVVVGTTDLAEAKSLIARTLGS
ncbi:MAG: ThiF family adenylyltransferase [Pirellulaceae bacterium]